MGLRLRAPPFCVKSAGGGGRSRRAVEAFDTGTEPWAITMSTTDLPP